MKNEGFVISYIPRSSKVHRALERTTSDFYKRHGDSFTPLSTEEIKALFFRALAPELGLLVEKNTRARSSQGTSYGYTFGLENKGPGPARFASLYVGFGELKDVLAMHYFDGEGNNRYPLGSLLEAPEFHNRGKLFVVNGSIIIYPGQKLRLFAVTFLLPDVVSPPPVKFKIFAEGMIPEEGELS
jgi:hypothetical protein